METRYRSRTLISGHNSLSLCLSLSLSLSHDCITYNNRYFLSNHITVNSMSCYEDKMLYVSHYKLFQQMQTMGVFFFFFCCFSCFLFFFIFSFFSFFFAFTLKYILLFGPDEWRMSGMRPVAERSRSRPEARCTGTKLFTFRYIIW